MQINQYVCLIVLGFCFFMVKNNQRIICLKELRSYLIDTKLYMQYRNFWGVARRQLSDFSSTSAPGISTWLFDQIYYRIIILKIRNTEKWRLPITIIFKSKYAKRFLFQGFSSVIYPWLKNLCLIFSFALRSPINVIWTLLFF